MSRAAAYLLGILDEPPDTVHVTVPGDRRIDIADRGIRVHHSRRLHAARHPARSPPRARVEDTVLDLVDASRTVAEVVGWVTAVCQRRLTTPQRLAAALAGRRKIRWRAEVLALVADVAEGAHSPMEIKYLRDVERRHGLPRGRRQWRIVVGRRVVWIDVDYERYRVRVELDGRVGHAEEGKFRDRRRDDRSARERRLSLRYGHAELFGDPCALAGEVGEVLTAQGWTGKLRFCGPDCGLRGR